MSPRLALLVLLGLAVACGSSPKPAQRPPPAPGATAAAAPQPAAPAAATSKAPVKAPEWSYSSVGKRDPFRSYLTELSKQGGELATRCATPLGKFEIEQLKLVAVVTGLENPVAMVQAPNGVGYTLRRGVCIGKNGGTVAAVRSGEVVVTEWAIRADGTRDRTQTVIRLPREAAMNLEE
ncbi:MULTISPECIES: pilus assembly protein PilP [Anaeromyxobacter]|uniref:pilus assembly protein PilP n=1 Tax=Anaeromyxobacter TaxID=161492 RepID=UPI001F5732BF|nr:MULTISPECIES: pilus assembly protein PilP [unclassified Anaeromyxobacter]